MDYQIRCKSPKCPIFGNYFEFSHYGSRPPYAVRVRVPLMVMAQSTQSKRMWTVHSRWSENAWTVKVDGLKGSMLLVVRSISNKNFEKCPKFLLKILIRVKRMIKKWKHDQISLKDEISPILVNISNKFLQFCA